MKQFANLLLIAYVGAAQSAEFTIPCTYISTEERAELEPIAECVSRRNNTFEVSKAHLARMHFSEFNVAAVRIEGEWHYVKPNGAILSVLSYDNGADEFREGLTRSFVNGKIAYYDHTLREVIPPKYDWGWPFEGGRAVVCLGCKKGKPDEYGYTPIVGGLWGYIDHKGNEVVPVKYSRESLPDE